MRERPGCIWAPCVDLCMRDFGCAQCMRIQESPVSAYHCVMRACGRRCALPARARFCAGALRRRRLQRQARDMSANRPRTVLTRDLDSQKCGHLIWGQIVPACRGCDRPRRLCYTQRLSMPTPLPMPPLSFTFSVQLRASFQSLVAPLLQLPLPVTKTRMAIHDVWVGCAPSR